jgi:hypothetical protein
MGSKYSTQSTSGYNSSPPADDGSTVAANKITWAGIKSKLTDVLKTFGEAINSALVTALDTSTSTTSVSYTTLAGDHIKPIQASGTITISLGDATTMAAGYQVPVVNVGTGLVTVGVITATDTLDGLANGTVKLAPGNGATFAVQNGALGYKTISRVNPYIHGADIASAATVNLDTSTGDCVDVTGTTSITAITLQEGAERTVRFTGALTLTNGASLVLPGGANITTAAGDYAVFRGYATGIVRCAKYTKASGNPVLISGFVAAQSDQETGSSTTLYVSPGRQQYHQSAAKGWARCDFGGTTLASYNLTSVTDTATGRAGFNWSTSFSSANYSSVATVQNDSALITAVATTNLAAGVTEVRVWNTAGSLADGTALSIAVFGDQ